MQALKKTSSSLQRQLRAAHLDMQQDTFLLTIRNLSFYVLIGTFLLLSFIVFLAAPTLEITIPFLQKILLVSLCLPLSLMSYLVLYSTPFFLAKHRQKDIDKLLSSVVHYLAIHHSSGVPLPDLFYHLAREDVFGALQQEANWIYRDIALLNQDLLSALEQAARNTPSQLFKDFLQGIIINIQNGGDITTYLHHSAARLQQHHRQQQHLLNLRIGIGTGFYCFFALGGGLLITLLLLQQNNLNGSFLLQFPLYLFIAIPLLHLVFAFYLRTVKEAIL